MALCLMADGDGCVDLHHGLSCTDEYRNQEFNEKKYGGTSMLRINNLTKTYGEKTAVDDLSLHIKPGEIYGFIG